MRNDDYTRRLLVASMEQCTQVVKWFDHTLGAWAYEEMAEHQGKQEWHRDDAAAGKLIWMHACPIDPDLVYALFGKTSDTTMIAQTELEYAHRPFTGDMDYNNEGKPGLGYFLVRHRFSVGGHSLVKKLEGFGTDYHWYSDVDAARLRTKLGKVIKQMYAGAHSILSGGRTVWKTDGTRDYAKADTPLPFVDYIKCLYAEKPLPPSIWKRIPYRKGVTAGFFPVRGRNHAARLLMSNWYTKASPGPTTATDPFLDENDMYEPSRSAGLEGQPAPVPGDTLVLDTSADVLADASPLLFNMAEPPFSQGAG